MRKQTKLLMLIVASLGLSCCSLSIRSSCKFELDYSDTGIDNLTLENIRSIANRKEYCE